MEFVLLIKIAKALVEVAGFAFLGQGLVALFAGSRRNENFVYQLFKVITGPVTRPVRAIMPRFILDRHIPFVAFGILLWVWMALVLMLASALRTG
jgi:hypothetical protein